MECHGLEMKGPIRTGDGTDAIEIESGTGKVSIKVGFRFAVGNINTYTLASDTQGNASWIIRSVPTDTIMLFLQASVPTGWTSETSFVDGAMLIYKNYTGSLYSRAILHDPKNWTPNVSIVTGGPHTHYMSGTTQIADTTEPHGSSTRNISRIDHTHTYSGTTTTTGSSHTHGITQAAYTPKYQEVILGKKT